MNSEHAPNENKKPVVGKLPRMEYSRPTLRVYGSVSKLTRSGNGSGTDGGADPTMLMTSDRAAKVNIIRVGTHPMGVGLYLFEYASQYHHQYGSGKHFGVMADEVESVMPTAVSIQVSGLKQVDYGMLGMRFAH